MSRVGDAGNGALSAVDEPRQEACAFGDRGRQIQHDVEALVATLREVTDGAQRHLTAQVEQRPLGTLSVAAGLGYLLGGGLSSRLTVVLLGAATRVATALVARELGSRIVFDGPGSSRTTAPEHTTGATKEDS